MLGIILAIISGAAMSIQGVFNTRVSEKIGVWETNTIVQGSAFVLALLIMLMLRSGNFSELRAVNKVYLLGGAIGVVITYTVMAAVGSLGPTFGISIILISQLLTAGIIDAFALFDTEKIKFAAHNYLGIIIMIIGIIIFKWKS
ncbi:DMT family transporter [Clostridium sp. LIBA-8841]|uniref:DMT family transporter n=1 Tax=Clostridium sp. LIBA-8841 TaxID=2987530 RepID=UPI002AC3B562|nr:DMT family transporter [Clostridium sp. LIBA-8841]MDZ5254829.1 DMT family transporter [Clostridium sp. LIBA-8841]